MTQIRIDTAEVENASSQFQHKVSELNQLTAQAQNVINNLQASFQGQRANRIYGQWQELQPNLRNAIETLQFAGELLRRAAADFSQADLA